MRHSMLIPALLAAGLAADASPQGLMLREAKAPAPATKPQEQGKPVPLQLARLRRAAPQSPQGLPKNWENRIRQIVRQEVRAAIKEALAQHQGDDRRDGQSGRGRWFREFGFPTLGFTTSRFTRPGAPFGSRFEVFFSDDENKQAKKDKAFFRWEVRDDDDDKKGKPRGFMVLEGHGDGHKIIELKNLNKKLENLKVKLGELQLHIVGGKDDATDFFFEIEEIAPEIKIERIKNLETLFRDSKSNIKVEVSTPEIHVEGTGVVISIVGPDGKVKKLKIGGKGSKAIQLDGVKGTLKLDGGVWRVEGEKPVKAKKKAKASLKVRKKKTTII